MRLEAIYEQYKDRVYNLALHYVRQPEDAAEITQDVFVKVHQHLPRFRGASGIGTWIYRITIRQCLDVLKARNRRKRRGWVVSLFQTDGQPMAIPDFQHPGVQAEHREAIHRIFHAIDQLPEKQRTALILSKLEQLGLVEIAAVLQVTPKAAESLLQRAKTNLKKHLSQNEGIG